MSKLLSDATARGLRFLNTADSPYPNLTCMHRYLLGYSNLIIQWNERSSILMSLGYINVYIYIYNICDRLQENRAQRGTLRKHFFELTELSASRY